MLLMSGISPHPYARRRLESGGTHVLTDIDSVTESFVRATRLFASPLISAKRYDINYQEVSIDPRLERDI